MMRDWKVRSDSRRTSLIATLIIAGLTGALCWREFGRLYWRGVPTADRLSGQTMAAVVSILAICIVAGVLCGQIAKKSRLAATLLGIALVVFAFGVVREIGGRAEVAISRSSHIPDLAKPFVSQKMMRIDEDLAWVPHIEGLLHPHVTYWFLPVRGGLLRATADEQDAFQDIFLDLHAKDKSLQTSREARDFLTSHGVWPTMAARLRSAPKGWRSDLAFLHVIIVVPGR